MSQTLFFSKWQAVLAEGQRTASCIICIPDHMYVWNVQITREGLTPFVLPSPANQQVGLALLAIKEQRIASAERGRDFPSSGQCRVIEESSCGFRFLQQGGL